MQRGDVKEDGADADVDMERTGVVCQSCIGVPRYHIGAVGVVGVIVEAAGRVRVLRMVWSG